VGEGTINNPKGKRGRPVNSKLEKDIEDEIGTRWSRSEGGRPAITAKGE